MVLVQNLLLFEYTVSLFLGNINDSEKRGEDQKTFGFDFLYLLRTSTKTLFLEGRLTVLELFSL